MPGDVHVNKLLVRRTQFLLSSRVHHDTGKTPNKIKYGSEYENHILEKQLEIKEEEAALDAEMEYKQLLQSGMCSTLQGVALWRWLTYVIILVV